MSFDSYSSPESEALLRSAQERLGAEHAARRELIVELTAATGYLVCATALAVLVPAGRPLQASALIPAVAVFVAAQRVKFPVAASWTWPTQLAFVPMLFVLPIGWVPLLVVALRLADLGPRFVRGEARPMQAILRIADGWYVIGPVLVLLAFGSHGFAWGHWPVYLAAFVALIVFNFVSESSRLWLGEGIPVSSQVLLGWVAVTDLALSCVGLYVAASAVRNPWTMLVVLPLIGLLALFARERTQRLDNTLALSKAYRGTAMLLGDVIEDDDEYTGVHSRSVVQLSVVVAERLGLGATQRQDVEFGALLHDVGKIRVPKEILNKPGKLNAEEWAEMKKHTIYGEDMLRPLGGVLARVGTVVRGSHERYDGSGYPDGLAGEKIAIESRIISACDAWSAMTTDRPYRKAMSVELAATELRQCAGTHFDPKVADALLTELGLGHLAPIEPRRIAPAADQPKPGPNLKRITRDKRALALR